MQGFLPKWELTCPKRRNSVRLPQNIEVLRSKTKQFREASSILNLEMEKTKHSARLLQKWKVECRADGLVPMRFVIFPPHLCKVLRLPQKTDARSYEVLRLSWCSKLQPLSGNQRPDLLISLMEASFVMRLPPDMHDCRSSLIVRCVPSVLQLPRNPQVSLTFGKVRNPPRLWHAKVFRATTACTFWTPQFPKVVRTCGAFGILTSKCRRAFFEHTNF